VRTAIREPLMWTGGIRESASGLIVEVFTEEGLVGVGEAPGPTLPAIKAIIDHRVRPVPGRRGSAAKRVARASARRVLAQLERSCRLRDRGDRDGAARPQGEGAGISVAELLGGYCRERVPVIGYLFIDDPEANATRAGRVRRAQDHGD